MNAARKALEEKLSNFEHQLKNNLAYRANTQRELDGYQNKIDEFEKGIEDIRATLDLLDVAEKMGGNKC